MSKTLGIGIVTYNRSDAVTRTMEAVRRFTKTPFQLVIADDGSTDDTVVRLRKAGCVVITGDNRGVAWNKNRALFALTEIKSCDTIVLLEDDAYPTAEGWEQDWIDASQSLGHVNLAGEWFSSAFRWGAGTPNDPVLSSDVSGQCEGFSRSALLFSGYLDTRFRGYGYGHVEHTQRMIRHGYGGVWQQTENGREPLYALIRSPIAVSSTESFLDKAQQARNLALFEAIMDDHSHRMPWRDDAELTRFRGEIEASGITREVVSS